MDLDELKVRITGDDSSLQSMLQGAGKALAGMGLNVSKLSSLLGPIGLGAIAAATAKVLIDLGKAAMVCQKDFIQAESATLRFNAAVAASGRITSAQKTELEELSKTYSKMIGVNDDVVLGYEAMLIASGRTVEEIEKMIPAAAGMSIALDKDLKSVLVQMNKMFSGFAGELGESEERLKALTQGQLRNGEGVDVLLKKYGALSGALADAGITSTKNYENAIKDLREAMGRGVEESIRPFRDAVAQIASAWAQAIQKHNEYLAALKKTKAGTADVSDEIRVQSEILQNLKSVYDSSKLDPMVSKEELASLAQAISDQEALIETLKKQQKAQDDAKTAAGAASEAQAKADARQKEITEERTKLTRQYAFELSTIERQQRLGILTSEEADNARKAALSSQVQGLNNLVNSYSLTSGATVALRDAQELLLASLVKVGKEAANLGASGTIMDFLPEAEALRNAIYDASIFNALVPTILDALPEAQAIQDSIYSADLFRALLPTIIDALPEAEDLRARIKSVDLFNAMLPTILDALPEAEALRAAIYDAKVFEALIPGIVEALPEAEALKNSIYDAEIFRALLPTIMDALPEAEEIKAAVYEAKLFEALLPTIMDSLKEAEALRGAIYDAELSKAFWPTIMDSLSEAEAIRAAVWDAEIAKAFWPSIMEYLKEAEALRVAAYDAEIAFALWPTITSYLAEADAIKAAIYDSELQKAFWPTIMDYLSEAEAIRSAIWDSNIAMAFWPSVMDYLAEAEAIKAAIWDSEIAAAFWPTIMSYLPEAEALRAAIYDSELAKAFWPTIANSLGEASALRDAIYDADIFQALIPTIMAFLPEAQAIQNDVYSGLMADSLLYTEYFAYLRQEEVRKDKEAWDKKKDAALQYTNSMIGFFTGLASAIDTLIGVQTQNQVDILTKALEDLQNSYGATTSEMRIMYDAMAKMGDKAAAQEIKAQMKKAQAVEDYQRLSMDQLNELYAKAVELGDKETADAVLEAQARVNAEKSAQDAIKEAKYKGELASWNLKLLSTTATAAQAVMDAYSSMIAIPFVGPGLAAAAAAVAGGIGVVQIAAVGAAKPKLDTGGIVRARQDTPVTVGKGTSEIMFGTSALGDPLMKGLAKMVAAEVAKTGQPVQLYLDGRLVAESTVKRINSGEVRIRK